MTVSLGEGRGIAPSKEWTTTQAACYGLLETEKDPPGDHGATNFWKTESSRAAPLDLIRAKSKRAKKAGIVARDDQLDHFRNLHESKRFAASYLITTRLPNITTVYLFEAVAIAKALVRIFEDRNNECTSCASRRWLWYSKDHYWN